MRIALWKSTTRSTAAAGSASAQATSNSGLHAGDPIVAKTQTTYDTGLPRAQSPFVAQNKTGGDVTFALVTITGDDQTLLAKADPRIKTVKASQKAAPGFDIEPGGQVTTAPQSAQKTKPDLSRPPVLNVPIRVVLLPLGFRTAGGRPRDGLGGRRPEPSRFRPSSGDHHSRAGPSSVISCGRLSRIGRSARRPATAKTIARHRYVLAGRVIGLWCTVARGTHSTPLSMRSVAA